MAAQENHIANYYTLRLLAAQLQQRLAGQVLAACVSLNRQELLLIFGQDAAATGLRIYLGDEAFVFIEQEPSIPRDKKYPFPELEGLTLREVIAHTQDRSFRLIFEKNFTLVLQLYGRNGNALLFQDDAVQSLFRPQFQNDAARKLTDYPTQADAGFVEYQSAAQQLGYKKALKSLFPAFTSMFLEYLEAGNWGDINIEQQWLHIQVLLKQLAGPSFYIIPAKDKETRPQRPFFLLLKPAEHADTFPDLAEALRTYAGRFFSAQHFTQLYNAISQRLRGELAKASQAWESAQRHLEELDHEKNYRAQADILMANLHQIPKGAESVRLFDFYQDKEVEFKLKRDVSPQRWAEKLYGKAKNQEIEREKALEKMLAMEEELVCCRQALAELESVHSLKELKTYARQSPEQAPQEALPFRKVDFEGYSIYVGKKAANNDRLTFGFAHKEDLWLHAKDYTGSHVIIRHRSKGQPFPMPVIERAAELAAWHSKGRTSSLCPVSYTLKKYVRKPKGAAPGAVTYEKEKVILVQPKG